MRLTCHELASVSHKKGKQRQNVDLDDLTPLISCTHLITAYKSERENEQWRLDTKPPQEFGAVGVLAHNCRRSIYLRQAASEESEKLREEVQTHLNTQTCADIRNQSWHTRIELHPR